MKTRVLVLATLIGVVIFSLGYEKSWANTEANVSNKVGVVSILRVFQECQRNKTYREKATEEQNKLISKLQQLELQIQASQEGLKPLKQGSDDYLEQLKEIYENQAALQGKKEFFSKQLELKEQQWMMQLYQDILQVTKNIAQKKGLDMVLENSEVDFSDITAEGLINAIRTHKVLYSAESLDITNEVIAAVDAIK